MPSVSLHKRRAHIFVRTHFLEHFVAADDTHRIDQCIDLLRSLSHTRLEDERHGLEHLLAEIQCLARVREFACRGFHIDVHPRLHGGILRQDRLVLQLLRACQDVRVCRPGSDRFRQPLDDRQLLCRRGHTPG